MTSIFVKPREGGRVRMPERNSQVMPATGAHVPDNIYYQGLLGTRDVERADPPKAAKKNAPTKPAPRAGDAT